MEKNKEEKKKEDLSRLETYLGNCTFFYESKEVEKFRRAYPKIRVLAFPKFTRKV
jgi:hypothetical protein